MRFFCTCDCAKARNDLADALRAIARLERDLEDLDHRQRRLQGRFGSDVKRERSQGDGEPIAEEDRVAKLNDEIRRGRRHAV